MTITGLRAASRAKSTLALLAVASLLSSGFLAGCIRDHPSNEEKERAVTAALRVYADEQAKGTDFSNGPCIAEEVIDDWSVDIAHDPRQDIDDQPENQCQFYRDRKTKHFVELDPEGNVLRVK